MSAWDVIEAVIEALDQPRNRMGKLLPDVASGEALCKLALELEVREAEDRTDQAVKVMRAFLKTYKADDPAKRPA